ncbi:membrane protein [Microbacterium phage Zeta1847]|uniref:Membrane protein n=1 Tax=Microbacterium phage Zeta1847 TaxID=2201444 RepID=A0A2Z4Q9S4_9CAUD|nr:membrane protein [Microbacterium phage Zeta1847]AWY06655.1 membrane protein [Microbacterium phage Zeta1847]
MSIPKTRAELRELNEARLASGRAPLYTATFWLDLLERVATSAASGAAAVAAAGAFNLVDVASWEALAVGAGTAALMSFLKGIAASRSGSASLVPGV